MAQRSLRAIMGTWPLLLISAAILVALLAYFPFLRRSASVLLRLVLFAAASFVAIAGIAMLMNNETMFAPPGTAARVTRFLTVDFAATSRKGRGDAGCAIGGEGAASARESARARRTAAPVLGQSGAGRSDLKAGRLAKTSAAASEEEDVYPELVTRGYPGIPRAKLFRMAQDTVNGLGGWRIVRSDSRTGSLDCVYTTRIFGFQDEVKIFVTRRDEIDLCSQSKAGVSGFVSWARFFHGDFGANIGHIKQFYLALEPEVDAFYKSRQE